MNEFEALLSEYRSSLERFIKYKISNRYDAEDIIQETYLAAYRNFGTLKNKRVFKSWIIGIAHHKCNDYFRRKAAVLDIPLDALAESALCTGGHKLKVTGNVVIHGVPGVEIESEYRENQIVEKRTIFAQLTDTHCRYLGGMHMDKDGARRIVTFLDESFVDSYGIGEDNCGFPTDRSCLGLFQETEEGLEVDLKEDISDICGRFEVKIGEKTYDTVRILDIQVTEDLGTMLCEYYVDKTGHTVLRRRFNKDDWAFGRHPKMWTEILPENERMIVNGETYVHWYDCITDYIL